MVVKRVKWMLEISVQLYDAAVFFGYIQSSSMYRRSIGASKDLSPLKKVKTHALENKCE